MDLGPLGLAAWDLPAMPRLEDEGSERGKVTDGGGNRSRRGEQPDQIWRPGVSLVSFHGFSLVPKYLRILPNALQDSQVFDLISSLPLLEDLT